MYSLKTDDISPKRKPIVKPYQYGEGYEHLRPKGVSKEDPNKIMNFWLKTEDIDGANTKKNSHIVKTRDILSTQDIDGAQPDPYKNQHRTKRFNRQIRKLGSNKAYLNTILSGKYVLKSNASETDNTSTSAYANQFDYAQPKDTKFLKQSRRYYTNHQKNDSNFDLKWRSPTDSFEYIHPLDQQSPRSDEGESDHEIENQYRSIQNEDYGHINNNDIQYQTGEDLNTPKSRQQSHERELKKIMDVNHSGEFAVNPTPENINRSMNDASNITIK